MINAIFATILAKLVMLSEIRLVLLVMHLHKELSRGISVSVQLAFILLKICLYVLLVVLNVPLVLARRTLNVLLVKQAIIGKQRPSMVGASVMINSTL